MQLEGGYNSAASPNKKLYNASSEWQDDIEGLADYYSTFFREYDPMIGRFNGVDPMSEGLENITTYHYSHNDPVNYNDPIGNYTSPTMRDIIDRIAEFYGMTEWGGGGQGGGNGKFINAEELFRYIQLMGTNSINTSAGGIYADANGVSDMTYSDVMGAWNFLEGVGVTPGYDGSEVPKIRNDGSRMFKNENEAYQWMYAQSISNNYREEFGVILKTSVLVLPDYKNTHSETIPENYGYSWENGNLIDPVTKKSLETVGTIHTHLYPTGYDPMPSFDDQKYFAKNTPNKPYLTMGNDENIYGNYGRWSIGKDGAYHTSDVKSYQISFTRSTLPINNATIMKQFPLRNYLLYYMKTFFR